MDRMKTFLMYFLLIVAFFLFTNFCSYQFLKNSYHIIEDYSVLNQAPKIEVKECKATYMNGYVLGTITNNTDEYIENTYIKVSCYNKRDTYLGDAYLKVENFQPDEVKEFKINYKYTNVKKLKIDLSNEATLEVTPDTIETQYMFLLWGAGALIAFWFM